MSFFEKLILKEFRLLFKNILIFFSSLAILIFVLHGLLVLGFGYALDYGEGTVLNQTLRMIEGQPLYPADISTPPYLVSNYPPVFILINALFMLLTGPNLFIGRMVVLLSTIGTAIIIGLIIHHFYPKSGILPGLTGAAVFLITPYVLQWSGYYRIDIPALLFSLLGLYCVIKNPEETQTILLAVLFFLLAAYTRQTFGLAAPFAAAIWVWTKNRQQALRLVLMYAFIGLAFFALLQALSRGGFFFHIIEANVNPFSWRTVDHFAREVYRDMTWLIIFIVPFMVIGWRFFKSYLFIAPYCFVSFAVAITIGKVGSNVNYLLEISAALALLAGVIIGQTWNVLPMIESDIPNFDTQSDKIPKKEPVSTTSRRKMWINLLVYCAFCVILIIQLISLSRQSLFRPIAWHRDRIKMGTAYQLLERSVLDASQEGPVLVDELSAMLSTNRIPFYFQPFAVSQLAMANRWDQTPFVNAIGQQKFPLIMIHHFPGYPVYLERWTPEMLTAIFNNYSAINFRANSLVFEPKTLDQTNYPHNLSCGEFPWKLPTQSDLGMLWYNRQWLMMGAGRPGEVPVYAAADGLLYQFPEWKTSVAIQHDDPFNPGKKLWTFYGDLAPAFDDVNTYVINHFIGLKGARVRAGDLIGYQGQWLGPWHQTWVHVRFAILPAESDGSFPQSLLPIDNFYAELPSQQKLINSGLNVPMNLSAYSGLPQSNVFGTKVFLPFQCYQEGR